MNTPSSRSAVVFCGVVLGLTAAVKIFALAHGSPLLAVTHPFLPGTFKVYTWLGLLLETAAFACLGLFGTRPFLKACLGMAIMFVGYHTVQVGLGIGGPCPCLGGFLGHWKPLANSEALISFLSAVAIGVVSFVALFPVIQAESPTISPQSPTAPTLLAAGLWLLFGVATLWLWHGRELGGDEGMEAAKALQWMLGPDQWNQVWNDQPPLLSFIGAFAFKLLGPVMTSGRVAVVLIGLFVPVTLAVYCARMGVRWAAPVAVVLIWLALPAEWAEFMQEAPAYALAIGALLPLLLHGPTWGALGISALMAMAALSIKLTAAFGLVIPFAWMCQRSWPRALGWGVMTVGLVVLVSFILPGWSWSTIASAHWQPGVEEIQRHAFHPTAYAVNWWVGVLALFAIGNRYVTRRTSPIIPWVVAAGAALLIHLVHRPFFWYYAVHLLMPLAVLGAIGLLDLVGLVKEGKLSKLERWTATTAAVLMCALWGWQRTNQTWAAFRGSAMLESSPLVHELKVLHESGHSVFAISPKWTFAAGMLQTPPELTILSLKRGWSGQMTHALTANLVASNHVAGIVGSPGMARHPEWADLLSGYSPTVQSAGAVLYVRNNLNPKPIELDEQTQMLRRMGL